MRLELEIMQAQYKKEAKKADARLRALENAAQKYKDTKYLEYAYAKAQRELNALGLGNRFDKKISDNIDDKKLLKMLSVVKTFNESETATYTGFERLDKQRYETLTNPKNLKARDWFPQDMTESEFLKITQLGVWDLLSDDFGFGYQTAIKIAKALTGNKKYIMNRKNKMKFNSMAKILKKYKFSSDPDLAEDVQGRLKDLGLL